MKFAEAVLKTENNRIKILVIAAIFIATALAFSQIIPQHPALALLLPLYIAALYLIFFRPTVMMMVVVLLTSTVFTLDAFPQPIAFGKAGLYLPEVIIVLLLMRTIVVLLYKRDFKKLMSPVTLPMCLFVIWMGFSMAHAVITQKATLLDAILIGRAYIYYFIFFLVLYYLDSKQKVKIFLGTLIAVAALCSVLSFIQYLLGPDKPIFPWETWNIGRMVFDEMAPDAPSLARVMPSSVSLVFMMFFPVLSNLFSGTMKRAFFYKFYAVSALLSLFVSFTRNIYYSVIIGGFLLWMNFKGKVGSRSVQNLITTIVAAGLITYLPAYFGIIKVPDWWDQIIGRQEEFIASGTQTETFAWRTVETLKVTQEAGKSPIIGNGIGATYQHPFSGEKTTSCHNGYLSILFQMGVVGLLIIFFIFYRFFASGITFYKKSKDEYSRNMIYGFLVSLFALLPAIWVKPVLVGEYFWIALLGAVWALPTVLARHSEKNPEVAE